MPYQLNSQSPEQINADLYVLAAFNGGKFGQHITTGLSNKLKKQCKDIDASFTLGHISWLNITHNSKALRIVVVGCGKQDELTTAGYRKAISAAFAAITQTAAKRIYTDLTQITVADQPTTWTIMQFAQKKIDTSYHYAPKDKKPRSTKTYILAVNKRSARLQQSLTQSEALENGVHYCRDLANTPPNVCTPTYLAKQAQQLARQQSAIRTMILDETKMRQLGMGALLAVSQGSEQPAKLICLQYRGSKASNKPVVLVGKGITFDTGGLSLKSPTNMIGMKYDMCGGASVFGTLKAAAELALPINIVGIIAAVENMPSGKATRPEDVVTSLSGKTVEILNTDAEGRLVLCDAITYAKRFKPAVVIDIATLTGAVIGALGYEATGIMGNDQTLIDDLLQAGNTTYDRAWQLPLWEEYQSAIDSTFADIKNIGNGPSAGSITAGCFLSRFADGLRWAHLDVAGTAMPTKRDLGATGRPVPLLLQYLINYSQA